MFSCKDVTALTSEQFDRPLTISERTQIAIHRMICPPCRMYKRQMKLLKQKLSELPTETDDRLAADAKERIRARMRQRQQK